VEIRGGQWRRNIGSRNNFSHFYGSTNPVFFITRIDPYFTPRAHASMANGDLFTKLGPLEDSLLTPLAAEGFVQYAG